jgi:hypothetical protein
MIVVMIAVPVLFLIALVGVDGSNAYLQKRAMQNAADDIALAAAQDLDSTGHCTNSYPAGTSCVATVNAYYQKNVTYASPPPLSPCTDNPTNPTQKNCYRAPYIDKSNTPHPGQIEVKLTQANALAFFGGVATALTHGTGLSSFDASARAVGALSNGSPPELTFAALNQNAGCDNHTLVIRSSGRLTVNNNIYVDSCNGATSSGKGDGFDIFGTGGCIMAKDIFVHGGWETHAGLSVYIPVPTGAPCTAPPTPCPLLTAGGTTPYQAGCPHTGVSSLVDPFGGKILPPALDPTGVPNNTCSAGCYIPSEYNPPYFLDRTIGGSAIADISLEADSQTGFPKAATTNDSYISVDGERMKAHKWNGKVGDLEGHQVDLVRGTAGAPVLGSVATSHSESVFTVTKMQRVVNTVTLTTSTAHNFQIGDWVKVDLEPNANDTFDGVFQVTAIPDFETNPNPQEFSYVIPGAYQTNVGAVDVVAVKRINGLVTVKTTADTGLNGGDQIIISFAPPYDSLSVKEEDDVDLTSVSDGGKTLTYMQSALLPDIHGATVAIKKISRFQGIATITTGPPHKLADGEDAIMNVSADNTFDGTFSITKVNNNIFTYPNPGADVLASSTSAPQNVTTVSRLNGVATVTIAGPFPNPWTVNFPDNYVTVNLTGADTTFNGTFPITALTNGSKTFTYDNPGHPNTLGPDIPIAFAGRTNTGLVTLTAQNPETLAVGDKIIVSLTSDTTFNNGGNPVTITHIGGGNTNFQYNTDTPVTSPTHPNNNPASGNVNQVGGDVPPPAGSTAVHQISGNDRDVTNPAGQCPTGCTVTPDFATDAREGVFGGVPTSPVTISGTQIASGPLFEIFKVNPTPIFTSSRTNPAEYTVPAGVSHAPLDPGTYYGGICIGAPQGATCGSKVGGTCAPSAAALTTVTLNPGIYIMAGGGFFVCGNTALQAQGVMIYNTVDSASLDPTANPKAAELDQVKFNTNGNVNISGLNDAPYKGMTIFQGPDPAPTPAFASVTNPNQQLSTAKCDGRAVNLTDIALLHMGSNGLGTGTPGTGIEGTIYAPGQFALFRDTVSGTNTLAVITGCIFIDGATSTFNFNSDPEDHDLFGIGYALSE